VSTAEASNQDISHTWNSQSLKVTIQNGRRVQRGNDDSEATLVEYLQLEEGSLEVASFREFL
jgi:hypothetical protein